MMSPFTAVVVILCVVSACILFDARKHKDPEQVREDLIAAAVTTVMAFGFFMGSAWWSGL